MTKSDPLAARHHRVARTGARLRAAALRYAATRALPVESFASMEADEALADLALAYANAIAGLARQR